MNKEIKEIVEMIDQDMAYQKIQLTNGFEADKSIHWRIIGMEALKKKILEKFKNEN